MFTNETLAKLQEMHLGTMDRQFKAQLDDLQYASMSFEDRFGLLVELAVARSERTYREYMKKLRKVRLLILDEWLLYPLKENEACDVLEQVESRSKTASTIFCSQFDVPGWHENLYNPTLADAICDRIVYDSYVIRIDGDTMRKRKGITE